VDGTISAGQLINGSIMLVAFICGIYAWMEGKDNKDTELTQKVDGVSSQISRLDGKVEALGNAQNAINNRTDLMDLRLKAVEDQVREARTDGATFQRNTDQHVNEVDARVRVLESYGGRK